MSGVPAAWTPTLGAVIGHATTRFRVWAPLPARVELVLLHSSRSPIAPMQRDGEYWQAEAATVEAGQRYRYRLDGQEELPDPCSRSQPDGVHGPSEVVDPASFSWTDGGFRAPDPGQLVVYELHVGTFTPAGTFGAAVEQLPRLAALGITAIELMPVATFPGRWGWGYDGAALFAPAAVYGGPDGLRRLVDAAHHYGLAVILDVVYNHFGPEGNWTGRYSPHYLTSRHRTPWGDAMNFDDSGSLEVRRFVLENLLHWHHEYHIDGFRFDATHAIRDDSPVHILAEARAELSARRRAGQEPMMIAETHENDVRYLKGLNEGGFGFDAVWADDFHHAVHALLTGEQEGYLEGFDGSAEALAAAIRQGFFFEGQIDPWLKRPRGTLARDRPWRQFLYCLQNHDQVGNRAFGERLHHLAAKDDVLAATLLLLLLPQTPLLFQGQEFMASSPFLYFTDLGNGLGPKVTEGRRREFASFRAFRDPTSRETIPDPQAEATFLRSKLPLDELNDGLGAAAAEFHRALLTLRRDDQVLAGMRRDRLPIEVEVKQRALLVVLRDPGGATRLLGANFGDQPVSFTADCGTPEVRMHSRETRFGGDGKAPQATRGALELPPHCGAVFIAGP